MDTRKEDYSEIARDCFNFGDQYVMKIHGTNSSSIVVDSESGILPWMDPIGWLWDSEIGQNGSFIVDSSISLEYKSWVSEIPSRWPVVLSMEMSLQYRQLYDYEWYRRFRIHDNSF